MFNFLSRKSTAVRTVEPALRSTFSEGEIASMARLGTIVHFSSGQTLMTEASEGTHAFFITSGTAAITRNGEDIAVLSEGDLVGERALITNEPRNATVTANMPVTALQFDRQQFAWLRLEWTKLKAMSNELVDARS